jgi:hypothetical protein
MVARHEMPGNVASRDPSRRVRSDLCLLVFIGVSACAKAFPLLSRVVGENVSNRSLRDGHFVAIFPGISCLATIIQSLRDKSELSCPATPWG